ncbi:putative glutamate--cysteine ligase 2 [Leucobacter sp. Psy1]|uniref:glutamate--cysteine ligase n=1 Tax=Leucobacter sp. Psy1 TaxID=2875729 RepID=UPI001CD5048E|nr:glutamate--cysteine ligase [Leucobacter sp. Psy1]UBH06304.1 putative glutamate--cysteine ligase 2 [Leucobacter sp. Psy1]
MAIEFTASPRSTLGIEWELGVIDAHSRGLANVAPQVLAEIADRWPTSEFPHATSELLENTIELVSAPHARVGDAVADLREMARAALASAEASGHRIIGSGSHPFSRWEAQSVTPSERYDRFLERTQWWGRNMLIWGVHVHLGIDRRERVIPIMHAVLAYLPHLQALAASSPLWAGEPTGYASNRALMFQQLPTAGVPWDLDDWEDFERVVDDLTRTGIIAEPTEARWDVRPAPRWGTIELRACDGASTLWEIGMLAAVSQCLVEHFQRKLDRGEALPRLQQWYVRENKWRAARYGLDAEVIVDPDGTQMPVRAHLSALLDELAPVAADLGCSAELASVARVLDEGNSASRQLDVLHANGGSGFPFGDLRSGTPSTVPAAALEAVVDALADGFKQSLQ